MKDATIGITSTTFVMAGVWAPHFISSRLPEGWLRETTHWWTAPTAITLFMLGCALIIGGVYIALDYFFPED